MKTFISIFVILLSTAGFLAMKGSEDLHRTCSCSGALCSCDVTCLDLGELPTCTCGALTCVCKCTPKDATNDSQGLSSLPTMDDNQENNSHKAEQYFRGLRSSTGSAIADGLRILRESIRANDVNKYSTTAAQVEQNYNSLSTSQKNDWASWSGKNLSK